MSYTYMFKMIIIGDTGVGKSCLLLQFIDKRFRQKHEVTIGVQFGAKMIELDNQNVKLQIWDTAGQESFKSITRGYYRSASAAVLVYDITNRQSFENVAKWLDEAKQNGNPEMCFVLAGNKCDMEAERQVSYEQGQHFAKNNGLTFLEVSAKTAYNVDQIFKKNAQLLLGKIQTGAIDMNSQPPGIKKGTVVSKNHVLLNRNNEFEASQKKKCC